MGTYGLLLPSHSEYGNAIVAGVLLHCHEGEPRNIGRYHFVVVLSLVYKAFVGADCRHHKNKKVVVDVDTGSRGAGIFGGRAAG